MKLTLYHIFVYFGTFMVYASLHMLRAGWSYSKADISKEFDVSTGFLGVVDALYLVSYSSGMIILGSLIHRFPLKNYVIIGLTTACISYMIWVVFYSLTGFYSAVFMVLFMMINGFAQSTGWPGIIGIFSSWFVGHKKGLLMGCWSCSANIGDIIASAFLNFLDDNGINFVWNFVFTGCVGLFVSLALLLFLQEKPDQSQLEEDTEQSLIEESQENREGTEDRQRTEINSDNRVQVNEEAPSQEAPKETTFKYGILSALLIPRVPNYVFAYACLKGCIYGLLFWLPTILDEHAGAVADQKGYISAMFDIGAVVGALVVGFLSDRLNKKALFLCPCLFFCAIMMFVVSFALGDDVWTYYVTIFLVGMFISGPYNIIGTVIIIDIGTSIKEKGSVTKISSLIEAFAAVFAMVEMIVIPHLEQNVVFYLFTGEMILATILLIPVFLQEFKPSNKQELESLSPEQ